MTGSKDFVDLPSPNACQVNAKFYLKVEFDAEIRLFNAKEAFRIYGTFYGMKSFVGNKGKQFRLVIASIRIPPSPPVPLVLK